MSKNLTPKDGIKVIGRAKQPKKEKTTLINSPSHSQLCKAISEYMKLKHPDKLFIHIANEGNLQTMGKLKAEGLLSGVYDYFLAHVKKTHLEGGSWNFIPGLWIEVKVKKDKLSKAQLSFRERALEAHYSVGEVHSFEEFEKEIEDYLGDS